MGDYRVENIGIEGKTLKEMHDTFHMNFLVSRLRRGEEVKSARSHYGVEMGDILSVVYDENDRGRSVKLFGIDHEAVHKKMRIGRKVIPS